MGGSYRHLLDKQEDNPEASITSEPYWIIGFVTYAVGSLTHGAALGFASQALLVPMEVRSSELSHCGALRPYAGRDSGGECFPGTYLPRREGEHWLRRTQGL